MREKVVTPVVGSQEVASASFVGVLHLFNHACNPNVAFDSKAYFDSRNQTSKAACNSGNASGGGGAASHFNLPRFSIVALRDVPEGGELCMSYTSTADGPNERREHLWEHYGVQHVLYNPFEV